ncbi:MAG: AsmA family protein [Nitrincola lacisaponensis]|uniref:AsmA family protein n=1 Tax=Nitrincola lacisaponensis TaxID=267850 RepID=UPI00391B8748
MKRLVKALAATVALLLLVLAAGLFYITSVMDPNDYKPRIEQLALQQAGLVLNIEGDISWSLYPWLGMQTGAIRLAYPDKPELARLESAQVSLQVIPLFSGRVEMSDVILEGLVLSLIKDAEGNVNWASAEPPSDNAPAESTPVSESTGDSRALPELDIASINLRQARIEYIDLTENSRIELSDLSLTTGRVLPGEVLPVELDFKLRQFEGADSLFELRSQLRTQLSFDLTDETVALQALQLNIGSLRMQGNLTLSGFSEPQFNGVLEASPFNLKALLADLGQTAPTLQDPNALERVAFNSHLQGDLKHLSLERLNLSLDDTTLTGQAQADLESGHLTLVLNGNQFNLDRYLPHEANTTGQSSSAEASASSSASSGWSEEPLLPVELLQTLNLSVTLDLERLTFQQRHFDQPGITLSAKQGLVQLERLTTQLYAGQLNANGSLDVRESTPQTAVKAQISNIQIGQLLQELADTDQLSGLFSADTDLTMRGNSMDAMIRSLNGQARIQMKDGVLRGIDMAQTVCQGIQTVTALGVNPQQVDRSTPFADLSGNFRIRNGVIDNNDLEALLDAMRLRGQGQVNLPTQSIDYRLGFTLQENLFQQTCSVNNRLEGLELPIDCKGQFDTPPLQMCRPDTSVFTQLLRQEVQRKIEERIGGSVEEQIRERVGGDERARDLIRGLLR